MANPFYVQPAGDITRGLSGLQNTLAYVGEQREQKQKEETAAQAREDAQADMAKAFQSGDAEQIRDATLRNPEYSKMAQAEQERLTGINTEDAIDVAQHVLNDPDSGVAYLQERIQDKVNRGRDPAQSVQLLESLMNEETKEATRNGMLGSLAHHSPKAYDAYVNSQATAGPLSPEGKLQADIDSGLITAEQATAEQETFTPVYDGDGNIVGQQSSLTNKVVTDPRAAESAETFTPVLNAEGEIIAQQNDLTGEVISDPRAQTDGKISGPQRLAAGFAKRTTDSGAIITELGSQFTGLISKAAGIVPQGMKSDDRQRFDQAKRNFLNAVLRRESGAAISPTEFESGDLQYFPQPGDSEAVLQEKQINRETVSMAMQLEAGEAYTQLQAAVPAPQANESVQVGRFNVRQRGPR